MTKSPWDEFLYKAHKHYEEIKREEHYKFALADALAKARDALLQDRPDWEELVTAAIMHRDNNLIFYINRDKFKKCIANHRQDVREALRELWSEDDRTPGDRIRAFDNRLSEVMLNIKKRHTGSRLAIESYLMMGIDAQQYPPFRRDTFRITYTKLGYPQAPTNDVGVWYEHALGFLDRIIEEQRGVIWMRQIIGWMRNQSSGSLIEILTSRGGLILQHPPIKPTETAPKKCPTP